MNEIQEFKRGINLLSIFAEAEPGIPAALDALKAQGVVTEVDCGVG